MASRKRKKQAARRSTGPRVVRQRVFIPPRFAHNFGYMRTPDVKRLMRGKQIRTVLATAAAISSDGAGAIDHVFDQHNPAVSVDGATAYTNWAEYLVLYDLYRVTAFRVEWYPTIANELIATRLQTPIFCSFDPDDTTAIGSYAEAAVRNRAIGRMINRPWKYKIDPLPPIGPTHQDQPGGWIDCANPHTQGAVKLYASNLTASVQYGYVKLTIWVEFKNRI